MRRPIRALASAFALALTGLLCAGGNAKADLRQPALAQAQAPQDDGPTQPADERTEPNEEPPAPPDEVKAPSEEEVPAPEPGPEMTTRPGETRRIDALDTVDDDEARAPHPAALAHPGHDVVVCEAGCDKTAGSIVFMKRRE